MSETVGQTVDKLLTADLKMWHNQEALYEVRRMSFDEYEERYGSSREKRYEFWVIMKKVCDLNVQRNSQIMALDKRLIELVKAVMNDNDLVLAGFLQNPQKTY